MALCWYPHDHLVMPFSKASKASHEKFWMKFHGMLDEIDNSIGRYIFYSSYWIYIYIHGIWSYHITIHHLICYMIDFTHDVSYRLVWCTVEVTNATSLPRRWCPTMRRRTTWEWWVMRRKQTCDDFPWFSYIQRYLKHEFQTPCQWHMRSNRAERWNTRYRYR